MTTGSVDVAPDDERNDWCVLRADEIDGASDADEASPQLGDGANAVSANAVTPPPPQCRSDGRVDAATLEANSRQPRRKFKPLETQNAQLRLSASDKVGRTRCPSNNWSATCGRRRRAA